MQITRGKKTKPLKTVVYGPEGIGKSTLASQFPDPLFIDTEGSTNYMDVARLPEPTSWTMLKEEVTYVKQNPGCCKTLVIDTADWAEKLCIEDVCSRKLKNGEDAKGIEDFGYGKGYVYVKESFGSLLNMLSDLTDRGINIVITAHAAMRKFEQPDELGAYDRWEMKLSKQVSPLVKEWADMVLFCSYKTMVINVDNQGAQKGKNKVQGGRRVMYTTHHACWDAKNRFGLPDEMDMSYESIRPVVDAVSQPRSDAPALVSAPSPAPAPAAADTPVQMTIPGINVPEDPVASAMRMTPEQAKETLKAAQGITSPSPDENPQQPAATAEKPKMEEEPVVSRYFSNPDRLPQNLKDLMEQDNICEWDIQAAVLAKGYYPVDTLIENMDPEFIQGWIVAFWPQVKALAEEIKAKEEIPFN